jgi:hypothetical protein
VMIGRPTNEADWEAYDKLARDWIKERSGDAAGFIDEWVMRADDGRVVMAVRFESKAAYDALGDDPAQDKYYQERMRPLLAEDPTWIDGEWRAYP